MRLSKQLLIIMLLLLASDASSQWVQVARVLPFSQAVNSGSLVYRNGFLFAGINKKLYVSKDTGRTWIERTIPTPATYYRITDIDFINDSIGIVTGSYDSTKFTTDQGKTWKDIHPAWGVYSVTLVDKNTIVLGEQGISVSYDRGLTWQKHLQDTFYEFMHTLFSPGTGTIYAFGELALIKQSAVCYSSDTGRTWIISKGRSVDRDSWSMDIDSTSACNFGWYVANEDCHVPTNGLGEVYISRDSGTTWAPKFAKPICHVAGSLAVTRKVIYCPTVNDGIYRSVDHGETWQSISGPGSTDDTRLISALDDSTVVVIDSVGAVWFTNNSGGYPIPKPHPSPIIKAPAFLTISTCEQARDTLSILGKKCGQLVVDTILLEGASKALFSLAASFPITLPTEGDEARIPVSFVPNGNLGARTLTIRIRGRFLYYGEGLPFDTTITITAAVTPEPPRLTVTYSSVDLGLVSTCSGKRDTSVTFINQGCDTLRITAGPGALPPEFIISPISYPYYLPPDSSITITMSFKPTVVGIIQGYPKYTIEQQGLTSDLELFLKGEGFAEGGIFYVEPEAFDFKSLSICGRDSGFGFVTNVGCANLSLDNAQLFSAGDYSMPAVPTLQMAPGDTIRYAIYLDPQQKGTRTGFVVFISMSQGVLRRDSIPLTVAVTDGTRILSASLDTIDFGTTTLCEERDSVVVLRNTGCDTLFISSADIQGPGFKILRSEFPLVIPPNESREVNIETTVDTIGGITSNLGMMTFETNADNSISPLKLTRQISYPKSYDMSLRLKEADGTAGDFITLQLVAGNWWQPDNVMRGVVKMDFDLAMNNDLLYFVKGQGTNNITANGSHVTIEGNPDVIATNGILAEFIYQVYLTRDSLTDITISNLVLNDGDPSACRPTIQSSGAGFSYRYVCGDGTIQKFLRTGKALDIVSIRPHPAQNELMVKIKASADGAVTLHIIDLNGKVLRSGNYGISSSLNEFRIDVHSIPSGTYILNIETLEGVVYQKFTINR